MKRSFYLSVLMVLITISVSHCAFAQKYKKAADSVKLNKEYTEVSSDIAELTVKLIEAQNELPGLQAKATSENSQAQLALAESSEESRKATSGDLGDVKKAKKKANKAVDEAEDAEDAAKKVKEQNKKIQKLQSQLEKKQKRLKELDAMRSAIVSTSASR